MRPPFVDRGIVAVVLIFSLITGSLGFPKGESVSIVPCQYSGFEGSLDYGKYSYCGYGPEPTLSEIATPVRASSTSDNSGEGTSTVSRHSPTSDHASATVTKSISIISSSSTSSGATTSKDLSSSNSVGSTPALSSSVQSFVVVTSSNGGLHASASSTTSPCAFGTYLTSVVSKSSNGGVLISSGLVPIPSFIANSSNTPPSGTKCSSSSLSSNPVSISYTPNAAPVSATSFNSGLLKTVNGQVSSTHNVPTSTRSNVSSTAFSSSFNPRTTGLQSTTSYVGISSSINGASSSFKLESPTYTSTRRRFNCHLDQCLRRVLRRSVQAARFCSEYIRVENHTEIGYPGYGPMCKGSYRISSACACFPIYATPRSTAPSISYLSIFPAVSTFNKDGINTSSSPVESVIITPAAISAPLTGFFSIFSSTDQMGIETITSTPSITAYDTFTSTLGATKTSSELLLSGAASTPCTGGHTRRTSSTSNDSCTKTSSTSSYTTTPTSNNPDTQTGPSEIYSSAPAPTYDDSTSKDSDLGNYGPASISGSGEPGFEIPTPSGYGVEPTSPSSSNAGIEAPSAAETSGSDTLISSETTSTTATNPAEIATPQSLTSTERSRPTHPSQPSPPVVLPSNPTSSWGEDRKDSLGRWIKKY